MLRIGLTGSIGSGKSTVAQLLRQYGIVVLDADEIARAVSSTSQVREAVRETFGTEYVLAGGLNRSKLAKLIFNNAFARGQLNAIIHPRVREQMLEQETKLEHAGVQAVVQDIPLLFENHLEHLFDAIILVDAPLEDRVARVMARDHVSKDAVLARDAAQMPALEKRGRAHFVIENNHAPVDLDAQLIGVLERLGVVIH